MRLDRVSSRYIIVTSFTLLALVHLAADSSPVFGADPAPRVAVTVQVEREVVRTDKKGRKVVERQPVDAARPGDVLVYTVEAVNKGNAPALDVSLQDPIPQGTVLIMESLAEKQPSAASLDGGKTWQPFPATITQEDGGGAPRKVPAPPESYTNLRWQVQEPIAPRSTSAVSFKVKVL